MLVNKANFTFRSIHRPAMESLAHDVAWLYGQEAKFQWINETLKPSSGWANREEALETMQRLEYASSFLADLALHLCMDWQTNSYQLLVKGLAKIGEDKPFPTVVDLLSVFDWVLLQLPVVVLDSTNPSTVPATLWLSEPYYGPKSNTLLPGHLLGGNKWGMLKIQFTEPTLYHTRNQYWTVEHPENWVKAMYGVRAFKTQCIRYEA